MISQSQGGDFCLECQWEGFHIDGEDSVDTSNENRAQWNCSDQEHHTSLARCEAEQECCEADNCTLDCGSICDGFVDCDTSTVCSVTHCEENHCDEANCESVDHVCFEDHCCDGPSEQDCAFDVFFGLHAPLSLDTSGMLPPVPANHHGIGEPAKLSEHILPSAIDPCYHQDFLSSYQAHATQCDQNVPNHFECHDFQRDLQGMFTHQAYSTPTEVNPQDVFHLLGVCPDDTSFYQDGYPPSHQTDQIPFEKPTFHPEHHHVHDHEHDHFKNPNDVNLRLARGPHRNHHRCRVHHYAHSHPYSPYSRQSRSSVSSHFLSSPGESPPPLEGGVGSVLTTPDLSAEDNELHICKWTTKARGVKVNCGATFADSGALQEHLVSSHMNTIDGARGNGYYCCWEGCHRPDEPFSQKSKLQGHFLTHSNYKNFKCSVCGKAFARQATLDRHERSHRGDKPYKCKDCGKAFTDSSELKTHSRTHTGEKPFKCTYPGCNFTTGDSSNMSSHRLTHGERKHKCSYPGCSKSFTRPDQLKRHQRTTHKQELSSSFPSPSPDHFSLTPLTMV